MVVSLLALPAMLLIVARRDAAHPLRDEDEDDGLQDAIPSLNPNTHGSHAHGE